MLEALQRSDSGELSVDWLAERFALSAQTIRKDLNELCELGLARRLHGGIGSPPTTHNAPVDARRMVNAGVKERIARAVAELIPEGASVALGIGTTVELVARHLTARRGLRVMTNNLGVAGVLSRVPQVEVYLAEGRLRHGDWDVLGESVSAFFAHYFVDVGVVGCGGLDIAHGVLDFEPEEAAVSGAILAHSRMRVLAADASKWGRRAMSRVVPLDGVDVLATDRLPAGVAPGDSGPRLQLAGKTAA
nr:DeoR/GlpR family DNA-binding transcription regulator [Arhodomonas aquaeolei]